MSDLEDWQEEAYWRFSLGLYSRPGVAPACLTLQDDWGVDVNVLLIALWAVSLHGRAIEPDELARADARVRAWRTEIIQPLRTVRRRMKTGPAPAPGGGTEPLREQLKGIELRAEHVEQKVLAIWALQLQGDNASDGPSTEDYAVTVERVVALYRPADQTPEHGKTTRERPHRGSTQAADTSPMHVPQTPYAGDLRTYARTLAESTVRYLGTASGAA